MSKQVNVVFDILIVVAASALAYFLEGLVNDVGWISIGPEARGASAVVGGALATIAVVYVRGGTLADLGFRRPERWSIVLLQALIILVAFVVAQALIPLLISLIITVPDTDWSRYSSLAGNISAAITMALVLPLTASIPEEIIYRGFLMSRLSIIFGQAGRGTVITVLIQALVFSSIHYSWGIGGVLMTFIMGIIWGTAYILCNRNLWPVILAHSGGHILFVISLYFGVSNT